MQTIADYDFTLPDSLIAQHPAPQRDASRLMVVQRKDQSIASTQFKEILQYFKPGDVLVRNDTRVIPARLLGRKETGGKVEVLLVRREVGKQEVWSCLIKASKAPPTGTRLFFDRDLVGVVEPGGHQGQRRIRFLCDEPFIAVVNQIGHMPLPPYIQRQDQRTDRERYQTVFAQREGAVAAPTAGLHFTEAVFDALTAQGVDVISVTLHVGLGTFLPMRVERLDQHQMHREEYHISSQAAEVINRAKAEERRVIALGTTTTRTLEHAVNQHGIVEAGSGESDLFIYPPFAFRVIDGLVTNFHLPQSTLLMLVCAFAGKELTLRAYQQAVEERYRFFSYGDCMFIF